jgi:hypothetical protein
MAIILTSPAAYEELDIVLERFQDIYGAVRMTHERVDGKRSEKPDDRLELNLRTEEVEGALASVSGRSTTQSWVKRSGSEDLLDPMREIGQRLYAALFQGERARFLRRSLEEARSNSRIGLRMRLRTRDKGWASLPWEFLHDGQEFISLSPWSPVVRTVADADLLAPRPLHPPLRVLAVTADATGNMQAQEELELLRQVAHYSADLKIRDVPQATREQFIQAVRAEDFDVLHFMGGARHFSDGHAALVLMRLDGQTIANTEPAQWVDAEVLKQLLGSKPELRLVYLSTCHTETLAAELASVVPAVIGMLGLISAQACLDFARGVYTSLLDGVPLEVAVTGGRQAVNMRHSGSREWGLPVLYLQASDGAFLVRQADEAGVEEVLTADRGELPSKPPSDPDRYREWKKLKLMREIHERNLKELTAQVETSLGKPLPFVESQIKETREQLEKLDQQLRALEGNAVG